MHLAHFHGLTSSPLFNCDEGSDDGTLTPTLGEKNEGVIYSRILRSKRERRKEKGMKECLGLHAAAPYCSRCLPCKGVSVVSFSNRQVEGRGLE